MLIAGILMDDELISNLTDSLCVTTEPCSSVVPAARFFQFKNRFNYRGSSRQDARRREFLKRQKQKRHDVLAFIRNSVGSSLGSSPSSNECCNTDPQSISDVLIDGSLSAPEVQTVTSLDSSPVYKPKRLYRDWLMLSEWLLDVPPDLEDYLILLCPRGKRALLVASHKCTKLYARNGFEFMKFASNLPGGNANYDACAMWKPGEVTILDVVYNDDSKTCFVLDLLCWRSRPYTDCDTVFRFYWLETQFSECATQLLHKKRKISVEMLPRYKWKSSQVEDILRSEVLPMTTTKLDGVLFYHPEGRYTAGISPLVGWLKPYMLPDVFGLSVHESYLSETPPSYKSFQKKVANSLELVQAYSSDKAKQEVMPCVSQNQLN